MCESCMPGTTRPPARSSTSVRGPISDRTWSSPRATTRPPLIASASDRVPSPTQIAVSVSTRSAGFVMCPSWRLTLRSDTRTKERMDVEVLARALSTLPADDDHPYRTGPWRPQTVERSAMYDTDDCDVIGRIPDDLDGVYLRNTENPVHPAVQIYHPFDGDAMVHAVGFRDGKAFYRNRFVRTDGFVAEQESGRPLWAGLAEDPTLSPSEHGWGARTRMKDASSTDVVLHNGVALTSFYQCGDLYRLSPTTLETLGKASWDGRFPSDIGVSAHPKLDERTGELLFFNYSNEAPYLHYGVVDAADHLVHYIDVPLPG